MNDVLQQISNIGIIPVIAIEDAEQAVPLARALVAGGLPAAEVTFRTAAGEEAIRRIAKEVPEMLVGAGTVLTKEQADRALAAGAQFIVSPGFNPEVTRYVIELANKFHKFYNACRVKGEAEDVMQARLALCLATRTVIRNVLTMLKINVPETM